MCALFEIYKPAAEATKQALNLDGNLKPGQYKCFSGIQIVTEQDKTRKLLDAFWQFRMQRVDGQLKADRYPSFNSRWQDKTGGGFKPSFRKAFKETRCIIPASAFVEGRSNPDGKSKGKIYHLVQNKNGEPIYFGGLYKAWEVDGDVQYSASLITRAGHEKLQSIHPQAMPLILPKEAIDMWLDPTITETEGFVDLMSPKIDQDMLAQRVKGFKETTPLGEAFEILKD